MPVNAIPVGGIEGDAARRARIAEMNRLALAAIDRRFRFLSAALLAAITFGTALGILAMTGAGTWIAAMGGVL